LELGIDIGDVSCVAQIGAPFSVASLRQRLGDLGAALASRRSCANMLLKPCSIEKQLCGQAPARPHPVNRHDRIATRKMVRACAIWGIAPFDSGASDIVDHCRKRWRPCPRLYRVLCQDGPFRQVSSAIFADVLRAMGQADPALIEQAKDGLLLLGPMGKLWFPITASMPCSRHRKNTG
jgi:ATP-dependent Lhr-like helicase